MPRRKTKEDFIKQAIEIHRDKYDYSKVNYINTETKVLIICKEHGEFEQTPHSHIGERANGCSKCSKKYSPNNNEFIKKAKKIHKDKYDYSKVEYKNSKEKIIIICKEHGEFEQVASSHLNGKGCRKCAYNNNFIKLRFKKKIIL